MLAWQRTWIYFFFYEHVLANLHAEANATLQAHTLSPIRPFCSSAFSNVRSLYFGTSPDDAGERGSSLRGVPMGVVLQECGPLLPFRITLGWLERCIPQG